MKNHNPLRIFKWTNYKMVSNIIIFFILVPFRLPITILLVKFFNMIANLEGTTISSSLLHSNIIVTKLIINILLTILFIYNMEYLSRDILGREPTSKNVEFEPIFWWTGLIIAFMIGYIIFDLVSLYDLLQLIIP